MKIARSGRIAIVAVSLISILTLSVSEPLKASATELTNDSIKKKEAEVQAAQNEKKALQNSVSDVKKLKKELEQSKTNLANYITELDAKVAEIQTKIEDLSDKIVVKEAEITEKEKELDEAIQVQTAQYEAMKKRIKFMYERGDALYMELFFNATNFSDALNKAEYIESLSAYDKRRLDEYVAYSEYVALCKQTLEEERSVLEETKKAQESEQKSVNELISDKEDEIARVNSDISNKDAAIAEYEAEIKAQNETIAALEAAIKEERSKLAAEQARRYDGGKFCNPCPSFKRISDDYGNRIHPITGAQQFHNGIDMAAPGGSPILAAYGGKVVAAAYSSSMGNYVMIDHGDNLYTIYMHASALYVSKGQEVSQGEKIAAVGSTGRSTGNHLHFSVRLNGSYVSPWNYLSN